MARPKKNNGTDANFGVEQRAHALMKTGLGKS